MQDIRSRYCCKSKRHEYLTLIFLTSSVLYIIAVHLVRVSSPEIHWWKNKNISFILSHLNLALSNYDGHRTYYTNYSTLKTSMDIMCSFPPDNLSKYEHIRSNQGILHFLARKSFNFLSVVIRNDVLNMMCVVCK